VREGLAESHLSLLLVAWMLYMTPSRTVIPVNIATQGDKTTLLAQKSGKKVKTIVHVMNTAAI
jgi:hypothetical protein